MYLSLEKAKAKINRVVLMGLARELLRWHITEQLEEPILPLTLQERYIQRNVDRIKGVQVLLSMLQRDVEQSIEQKRQEALELTF